ncbi:MAG: immune inhibitor A [Myxococcota bacterium]|jgi:M6 family metalloprotease-like protein|nr:immune inhibitor A [Myxococcota bacterium]
MHSIKSLCLGLFFCCAASGYAYAGFVDHLANTDDIGLDKAPHVGQSRILVIPIIVQESNLIGEEELLSASREFYGDSAEGFTFNRYFQSVSQGRFSTEVELSDPVYFSSCPFSYNASGICTVERGDLNSFDEATIALQQVLNELDEKIDFSHYDINGAQMNTPDGYIDGLMIITNINFGGIALPFWRLCEAGFTPGDACRDQGDASNDWIPVYDGIMLPWVAISGVRTAGGIEKALRVSVHEFGHLLGFLDLYDESGESTSLPYSFMGGWTYGENVPVPTAFSRYMIGWGNPQQAKGSGTYNLKPAAQNGEFLRLGTGQEYFLVENRSPQGLWDADIDPAGLAIHHIDELQLPGDDPLAFILTIAECVQCDAWAPLIMTEQADGLFELQKAPGNRDDDGDLFGAGDTFPAAASGDAFSALNATLNSNYYSGESSGIALDSIVAESDGSFSFRVEAPSLDDACLDLRCPANMLCQDGVCVSAQPTEEGCACQGQKADLGLWMLLCVWLLFWRKNAFRGFFSL